VVARERIDAVDLLARAKRVEQNLLPLLDVQAPVPRNDRVGAGAMEERVVPAERREHLDQRFRRRERAREHGLRRNKQADLVRYALRIPPEKWRAWEGELHVRKPQL
jgi:hypothetical protein